LPWSLLLFAALFQFVKKGSGMIFRAEWYCLSGAMLTFLLFSASSFQLPHYLNIVFPFFAIITAQYLYNINAPASVKAVKITQAVIFALLLLVIIALHYFYQPETLTFVLSFFLGVIFLFSFLLPQRISQGIIPKVVLRTVMVSFIVNLYLNQVFYKSLLKYQAGSEAAAWINEHNPKHLPVVQVNEDVTTPFQFYINPSAISMTDGTGFYPTKPYIIYGSAAYIKSFSPGRWEVKPLKSFDKYWVSRLKPAFLNKATREKELVKMQVALVTPK